MNKTKVIAVRVTQEEYDSLNNLQDELGNNGLSRLVYNALAETFRQAKELEIKQRRAFERKVKREAKKAAANAIQ